MALLVGADQEERFAGPDPRRARGPKSRVADGSVWTGSLGQARETPRLSAGAALEAERLWERSLADDGVGNPGEDIGVIGEAEPSGHPGYLAGGVSWEPRAIAGNSGFATGRICSLSMTTSLLRVTWRTACEASSGSPMATSAASRGLRTKV